MDHLVVHAAAKQRMGVADQRRRARHGAENRNAERNDGFGDQRARFRLARGRYRVFKIEDQAVGAALACLLELAFAVAGNKQKRPQPHDGFLNIKATRLQTQISSPR